jgi:hypothetical protein
MERNRLKLAPTGCAVNACKQRTLLVSASVTRLQHTFWETRGRRFKSSRSDQLNPLETRGFFIKWLLCNGNKNGTKTGVSGDIRG